MSVTLRGNHEVITRCPRVTGLQAVRRFGLEVPRLEDFRVRIPPGGRTAALVETIITWKGNGAGSTYSTLGVDSDQLAAAVVATEKMLNTVAARGARPRRPSPRRRAS